MAIDEWVEALRPSVVVETEPQWMPDANHYFARVFLEGIALELSIVEIATDDDTIECIGPGPWVHFDLVPSGAIDVPAVATELRLLSELAREREDRYRPIIRFLKKTGCDFELIHRGLVRLGITHGVIEELTA